ncbi:hypothetical protein ACFC09_41080 [Streptomyces sp. NPDC056161]|uniref:hypothetical protein n=1 Tax=Streptomyces sp. NPDC056161 TaxID=3345732 RepID=UPI0035D98555
MARVPDEAYAAILKSREKGQLPEPGIRVPVEVNDIKVRGVKRRLDVEFGHWFRTQRGQGRRTQYPANLVEGFKEHGFEPENYSGGYRIVPIKQGEQRDHDQSGNSYGRGRESSRAPGAQEASGGFPGRSGSADASVTPGNQAGTGAQSQAMYPSAIPSLASSTAHGQGNEYQDPDFVKWIHGMDNPMELLYPPNFGIQGAMGVSDPAYGFESQEFQGVSFDHAFGFGNQAGFSTLAFPTQPYGYSGPAPISMDYGQYAEGDGQNTSLYNSLAGPVWGTQPDLGQAGQVGSVGQSGNYGAGSNAANQPMTAEERAEKEQELARLQAELRQLKGTQWRGEVADHGNYSQASTGMEYGRSAVGDGPPAVGYGQPAVGYGQSSPDQNPIGNSASQTQPPSSKANSSGTRGGGDRETRRPRTYEEQLERLDAKLTELENLVQRPDVQQRLRQQRLARLGQQAKPQRRR